LDKKPKTPSCPGCGGKPFTVKTVHGWRSDCCGLWSWHGKPLTDGATHQARQAAHAAFDALWKGQGPLSRLARIMGMTSQECHISRFGADQAKRVVEIAQSGALLREADSAP